MKAYFIPVIIILLIGLIVFKMCSDDNKAKEIESKKNLYISADSLFTVRYTEKIDSLDSVITRITKRIDSLSTKYELIKSNNDDLQNKYNSIVIDMPKF